MAYTTIDNPGLFFNTILYTGNGTTNTAQTGVGFQPDWTWIKSRSTSDYNHFVFDAVRGATKYLKTDGHAVESTLAESLKSFDTDGFTVGTESDVNNNSTTYVAWNWKANGTGSSNSDGGISSTVSVNTTAGFSIVSYAGNASQPSTVGHGLGAIPEVVLVKPRNDAQSWCMYHEGVGNTKVTYLDITSGSGGSSVWNDTSPTSSVFTVNDNQVNKSSTNYIAYCFKEIKGYSKFGTYTGNNNADGTFVYTGFKPAWVMTKITSASDGWMLFDNKRNPHNVMDKYITADGLGGDSTRDSIDFVSNGFKLRVANADCNNGSYIYLAFAESPFVTAGTKAAGTAR